jgi:mannose-6-phosphate isomerase-like protein (cupin superfamily)
LELSIVSPEIPCFAKEKVMNDFPEFMRNPSNRIASQAQYTPGIEGYVFDGIDGSQIAIWTNRKGGISVEHTHEYDEYFIVVQGQYDVIIGGKRIPVKVGEEYFIPKGTLHGGVSLPGTRTINAFGGKRAIREIERR